jgi:hypothetical protein
VVTPSLPSTPPPVHDEDDDSSSDNGAAPVARATRTFRPLEFAKATQLRFYSGLWVEVLRGAKNIHRFSLHTTSGTPFPERNTKSLDFANECIFETIARLTDDQRDALDEGTFFSSRYLCLLIM